MKLIIDIDDKDYEKLKDGHIPFSILNVIQNGIPLDELLEKLFQEIKEFYINNHYMGEHYCTDVLRIIDKYRIERKKK